jgi:hypothetical protein
MLDLTNVPDVELQELRIYVGNLIDKLSDKGDVTGLSKLQDTIESEIIGRYKASLTTR